VGFLRSGQSLAEIKSSVMDVCDAMCENDKTIRASMAYGTKTELSN
jgi:hypothetical protein